MHRVLLNNQIISNDIKSNIQANDLKAVVTIGNFDGLHLGHVQLLTIVSKIAVSSGLRRVVITFEPSPQDYFSDYNNKPRLPRLSLLRDKVLLLKQLDLVDELVIIKFNSQVANLTPDEFITDCLLAQFKVAHVVIGHDFRFGWNKAGNAEYFSKYKIVTTVTDPVVLLGNRVSSSLIRDLANHNQLAEIRVYLGRNIQYTSRVIHGNHIGRTLGVPTINLCLGRNMPALWGIYLAYVYIDNVRYNAVASIGKNPTVSSKGVHQLEAHLLDVDLDLYGKIATIEILEFMRAELKFDNMHDLVLQMQMDLLQARDSFSALN